MLPARCASPLQSWSHGASEGRCDRHCGHLGTRETGGAVPKVFRFGGHRGSEGLPKALGRTRFVLFMRVTWSH